MRYLVILKAEQATTPPPDSLMAAIMKLGDEATQAGVLLDNGGLAPSAAGARVELSGGRLTATDGPFTEAKEMISYALYQVRAKEEVVEWTSRFLRLHQQLWPQWQGSAEITRVLGPEDFAPPA